MSDHPNPKPPLELRVTERRRRRSLFHPPRRSGDSFWRQVWVAVAAGIILLVVTNGATYAWHYVMLENANHNWRVYTQQLDARINHLNRELAIVHPGMPRG